MTPSTTSPESGSKLHPVLRAVIPLAFWLGVWQFASFCVGQELLLPSPLSVAGALGKAVREGDFWLSAGSSLLRIFLGLVCGTLLGVAFALLTSFCRWADAIFSPAIRVVRATPVASFILLVLLWVTRTRVPAVISALMVLPVVWGAVCQGVRGADPRLLEMAKAYRFDRLKTLRLVYLPSAYPAFSNGVRTALGLAWKSGVAAEVICIPRYAIGTQVYYSKLYLETPLLFAWTLVVILLSFLLEKLVGKLLSARAERREKAWK